MVAPSLQPELMPLRGQGAAPLESGRFGTPQDADRLSKLETVARARAVARGLGSLEEIEDLDLRKRISAEFDAQIRMLVKHMLEGLVARDTSGALRRALDNARAALGQEPQDMPFMDDLVTIARGHLEDLIREADGLSDDGIGRFSKTLEAVLGPQLDRLAEVDNKKIPPGEESSFEARRRAA